MIIKAFQYDWLNPITNMPPRSHYDVLQLESRSATPDEIKRAFRRLSMDLHPDKNGNSEESKRAFQEINEAYNVLGDPEKRGNYDFELQMGIGGHRIHMGGMGPMGMGMGSINPLDMLFAAMHQQPQHQSPRNQAQHMFEAMFGGMGGMGPKIIIHNFTQNMAEEREEREEPEALDDRERLSSPPSSGCPGATTPKPSAFPSPRERMLWDAVNASLPTELSPTDSCADTAGPASAV
jgi:curved DNA-binding protein CbpA